jgi:hypothetical protein
MDNRHLLNDPTLRSHPYRLSVGRREQAYRTPEARYRAYVRYLEAGAEPAAYDLAPRYGRVDVEAVIILT